MTEKTSKDGLLQEEIEEIKSTFKKYDLNNTGKINVKRFIKEMQSIGLDIKASLIFKIFTELDNEETDKKGGVTIDEVLDIMNKKIGNTNNEEGMKKAFELLKEDSDSKSLNLNKMKELATNFGIDITNEEIKNMLKKATNNADGLTFEEFCKIMSDDK